MFPDLPVDVPLLVKKARHRCLAPSAQLAPRILTVVIVIRIAGIPIFDISNSNSESEQCGLCMAHDIIDAGANESGFDIDDCQPASTCLR